MNALAVQPITLRRASAGDLAEVASIERRCYSDPWPTTAFASLPDNPDVYFTVATQGHDGPVVGFVITWRVLDEGELANLAVDPLARRSGIGTQLLDAAISDATQRGVARIYLEVRESNAAARRLYASRNFAEVGRRKKYYRLPEEDALILRREKD
jgi:ribosomal-protein-alanine N-acetyltransferase